MQTRSPALAADRTPDPAPNAAGTPPPEPASTAGRPRPATSPPEPGTGPWRRSPIAPRLADARDAAQITEDPVAAIEIQRVESPHHGFDAFYRTNRPSIGRAVALALGDVDLAADATDEAFARAYERWGKVSTLDKPEGWIYRVALNWATSVLRRRRNQRRIYLEATSVSPAITDPAVHAGIAELDVNHRAVVVCRHLLGWSVAETAAALRVREGTVKSRLHRANRQLQARLRHLDPTVTSD